ncbi:MAG: preprotein translocase subunit YajC [Actinomycetota bacterium]|nr:preprotein translocase subunit YajC [Actinomycetota bacterium]
MDVTLPADTVLLAQAASEGLGGLVLPLVFLALLYVLLIRPQSKRRRELTRLVASLREGDLVVTLGGIHGEIVDIADGTVDLAVSEDADGRPDAIIRFERSSIVRVLEKSGTALDPDDDPDDGSDDGSDSA